MIVQCESCQTRFRLADEKIKPGGTKVRCSKCKEVFTVMPAEPEPVEEAIDFGSFNMERVPDEQSGGTAPAEGHEESEDQPGGQQPPAEASETAGQPQRDELDFSSLEKEMSGAGLGEELADDFSFADASSLSTDTSEDGRPVTFEPDVPIRDQFRQSQAEGDETRTGPVEFDFTDDSDAADTTSFDISSSDQTASRAFSFDDDQGDERQDAPGEFSFDEEGEKASTAAGDAQAWAAPTSADEFGEPGEFSFDEENPFGDDSAEWSDDTATEETSFDFDEPRFDTNDTPPSKLAVESQNGGLHFGEIDFANDKEDTAAPAFQTDTDFSKATIARSEEPDSIIQRQQSHTTATRKLDDDAPLHASLPAKKSSLSRIVLLLMLLLVILACAAGYLFMQEGSLSKNTVLQYLPFLRDYIGGSQVAAPGDRISINITGSSYVNGQAGQMLVIQGEAVNNHPATRSAITIKGILLDAKGKTLLQQTVFCGNRLSDAALKTLPFSAIEEAMNNQFGDSLSNMNVAAGAAIPFTIVFRNLPAGVANINVEVVDSKPGAS